MCVYVPPECLVLKVREGIRAPGVYVMDGWMDVNHHIRTGN